MSLEEVRNYIINSEVVSEKFGRGEVVSVKYEEHKGYSLEIHFLKEEDTVNRLFSAKIAIEKGIIVLNLPEREDEIKKELCSTRIEAKQEEISAHIEDENIKYLKRIKILIYLLMKSKPIAYELIDLFDDCKFESYLYKKAFGILEKMISYNYRISEEERACIIIALSFIGLKYYDGDLHGYIEEKFRECYPNKELIYTRAIIQNTLYNVIRPYRERVKYFDSHSYVAVPLVLCCVPHYRIKDLFSISYDIYKRNLLFDEDLADEQICQKVEEILGAFRRKELVSDSDNIKGTSYLMSKYTQSCIFSGYGLEELAKIISHCIRLIIYHLSRPEDSFVVEEYYQEGYSAWVSGFENDGKEKQKYENNKTISRPYLLLKNNTVHLVTGEYSMDDSLNPNFVSIRVFNGDKEYKEIFLDDPNDILIDENNDVLSGYIVGRKDIAIDGNPLGQLSYSIYCEGKEIYSSKNRIHRNIIFFDGKGNEVKPGTVYDGEIYVLTYTDNKEEYGDSIHVVYREADFVISSIEVNSTDTYRFESEPYIFYKVNGSRAMGYEIPWASFISVEGKEYSLFSDFSVLFQASCNKEDIYLLVDGEKCQFGEREDLSYKIKLFSNEFDGNWIYLLTILNMPAGYHNLRIFNSKTNKQVKSAEFNFIYDGELWKKYVSKDDKAITYELTGECFETKIIDYEYGCVNKTIQAFVKNLGYGSIQIHPSSISYSIDGEKWFDIDKPFCLYEIPEDINEITLCGPRGIKAYVNNNEGIVKKQYLSIDEKEKSLYKLQIGFLRTITDKTTKRIILEYGSRSKYFVVKYYPFVIREECDFYYDELTSSHVLNIKFEGNSKVKVNISPVNLDNVILSKEIHSGEIIRIDKNEIGDDVQFLSVALYGRKYYSIFEQYQSEPFFTFPKYDINVVKLKSRKPIIDIDNWNKTISTSFEFEGTNYVKVDLYPLCMDASIPLASRIVKSMESIQFDYYGMFWGAYKLYVYPSKSINGNDEFEEKPLFISKNIYTADSIVKRQFRMKEFVLDNDEHVKCEYSLYFAKVIQKNDKYFFLCSMTSSKGIKRDNILIRLESVIKDGYLVDFYNLNNEKITRLKLKDGRVIKKAKILF